MSIRRRSVLAMLVLFALATCALLPHGGGLWPSARAAPPTGKDPGPLHVAPALKGPKAKQSPAVQSELMTAPACLLARYAALDAKVLALKAKHGKDKAGFDAEHATEKKALVGDAALAAAGCKVGK